MYTKTIIISGGTFFPLYNSHKNLTFSSDIVKPKTLVVTTDLATKCKKFKIDLL